MSNIAFEHNGKVEYLLSINTPDYPNALVNPDITILTKVEKKYWKIESDAIVEMTAEEKQVVDTVDADTREAATQNFENLTAIVLAKAIISSGLITKVKLISEIKKHL